MNADGIVESNAVSGEGIIGPGPGHKFGAKSVRPCAAAGSHASSDACPAVLKVSPHRFCQDNAGG